MREGLDHWNFVYAAYVLGVLGTLVLTGWSWLAMRRAEARRERSREQ
jgi:nitrate reductase gamma subunit